MGSYLEDYLHCVSTLPADLERNFKLMRELDSRAGDLVREIDTLQKEYHPEARKAYEDARSPSKEKVEQILGHLKACLQYSDEKVDIATQTYQLVDQYIRRLDGDLARFEEELEMPLIHGTSVNRKRKPVARPTATAKAASPAPETSTTSSSSSSKRQKTSSAKDVSSSKKNKSRGGGGGGGGAAGRESEAGPSIPPPGAAPIGAEIHIAADPNEPLYCLCQRPSYNLMVGCDGVVRRGSKYYGATETDDGTCLSEARTGGWFHYPCVGITEEPKGTWYCFECRKAISK